MLQASINKHKAAVNRQFTAAELEMLMSDQKVGACAVL